MGCSASLDGDDGKGRPSILPNTPLAVVFPFKRGVPSSWSHLEFLEGDLLLAVVLGDEETIGLYTGTVVLHVQRDGAPRLGTPSHVVELESHQSLHQCCDTKIWALFTYLLIYSDLYRTLETTTTFIS